MWGMGGKSLCRTEHLGEEKFPPRWAQHQPAPAARGWGRWRTGQRCSVPGSPPQPRHGQSLSQREPSRACASPPNSCCTKLVVPLLGRVVHPPLKPSPCPGRLEAEPGDRPEAGSGPRAAHRSAWAPGAHPAAGLCSVGKATVVQALTGHRCPLAWEGSRSNHVLKDVRDFGRSLGQVWGSGTWRQVSLAAAAAPQRSRGSGKRGAGEGAPRGGAALGTRRPSIHERP